MNKRSFLGTTLLAGAAGVALPARAAAPARGPVLLTVTGALARSNRGPLDPRLDVLMSKHKLAFGKAYGLDFAALAALPAVTIKPTLEYDAQVHVLRGPLLLDVLAVAGARPAPAATLVLRALDGYAVTITAAQAREQRCIVATHMDGKPMALGGLGPLWAVIDADRIAGLAGKPLPARFAHCPWGLYHVDVQA